MSSIYVNEPPTNGKVILKTTMGEIEIELWPKESPLACRNFIQHCLEHYFDQTIFHRLVPKFILQGGDPTGTGTGGESVFGRPFKDEFHQRLRFTHRGLLAMANDGPDRNRSQFFITLDRTEDLQNKHTIFGKVVGDTMFNVMRMGEQEVDAEDRPLYPPRILSTVVLSNPFEDLIPRNYLIEQRKRKLEELTETAAEKRIREVKKRKGVKNAGLLSFGDDQEDGGSVDAGSKTSQFRIKSAHEVVQDSRLVSKPAVELPKEEKDRSSKEGKHPKTSSTNGSTTAPIEEPDLSVFSSVAAERKKEAVAKEIEKLTQELKEQASSARPSSTNAEKPNKKSSRTLLEEQQDMFFKSVSREKVLVGKRDRARHSEDKTLEKLFAFQSALRKESRNNSQKPSNSDNGTSEGCKLHGVPNCESCHRVDTEDKLEVLDKHEWMTHELRFEKDLKGKNLLDPSTKRIEDVESLVVIDPRDRMRSLNEKEEGERRKADRAWNRK